MPINLLYHDVTHPGADDSSGFPGAGAARYKLSTDEFEQHLAMIDSAIRTPPLIVKTADEWQSAQPTDWAITFDDGGKSAFTEIATRLERRGWRGWFFITTDVIGTETFCSRDEIRDLHRRGHVIGSHSCSHPERFSSCSWDQLVDEWTRSCEVLSQIIEEPVITGSVPGGFFSPQVARAASQAGIKILFNSEPVTTVLSDDGLIILGRYNLYRGMPASDAARLLRSSFRRWRQSAFWSMKKAAKVFAGPAYRAIRQTILSRRYQK